MSAAVEDFHPRGRVGRWRLRRDAGLDASALCSDDIFERRRDENVALHVSNSSLVMRDARACRQRCRNVLVADGFDGVDAAGVGDAARVSLRARFLLLLGEKASSGRPRCRNPDGDGRARRENLLELAGFFDDVRTAARGSPVLRNPPMEMGFAGNNTMPRMAMSWRRLSMIQPWSAGRCNIRPGMSIGGSDDRQNLAGVTAGHRSSSLLDMRLGSQIRRPWRRQTNVDSGVSRFIQAATLYFIERDVGV